MITALALTSLLAAAAPAKDASGIRWIADDWAKAKAQALAGKQLVAVDVWATWCHTCLSMKHFVLTDRALARVAQEHVWLMLDFDRPENADFFARFPVTAFPTFLVVDPATESVVSRWVGSGTPGQMTSFFAAADRASQDPLVLGHRALAREEWAQARALFERGLAAPGLTPDQRTRLLAGHIEALWKLDPKLCAEEGMKRLKDTEDTAPGVDHASFVVMCADELPAADKQRVLAEARARLEPVAARPPAALTVDDLSGMLDTLTGVYEAQGDQAKAQATLQARARLLDEAAARAGSAAERATFDAHRLDCAIRLGRFAEAEKMLSESEAAQPTDFNHPYRLAVLYLKQGKSDPGLAAIERALARGYGARKLRLYSTQVDLLLLAKRYPAARATIAQARGEIAKMNPKVVRASWLKELEAKSELVDKREKGGAS